MRFNFNSNLCRKISSKRQKRIIASEINSAVKHGHKYALISPILADSLYPEVLEFFLNRGFDFMTLINADNNIDFYFSWQAGKMSGGNEYRINITPPYSSETQPTVYLYQQIADESDYEDDEFFDEDE